MNFPFLHLPDLNEVGVLRVAFGPGRRVVLGDRVGAAAYVDPIKVRGIPSALRDTDHAGHDGAGHKSRQLDPAAVIEDEDHVAVLDAPCSSVHIVHPNPLRFQFLHPTQPQLLHLQAARQS